MAAPVQPPAADAGYARAADAVATLGHVLSWLAAVDPHALAEDELKDCLRGLEHSASLTAAARSRVLQSFNARQVCDTDARQNSKVWLTHETRVTVAAAGSTLRLARDLAAHPRLLAALAAGQMSESWVRDLCERCDKLPADARDAADEILVNGALGGATLKDLHSLLEEIRDRTARPDSDPADDGYKERSLDLELHWRGHGKLTGNLTPACAAALDAAIESLAKKRGRADDRTATQRRHDALEDLCRMQIAGGLPDTAGQPTLIHLHMTLDQLRGLPGAADAERTWAAGRAGSAAEPGWITDAATAQAYACDAQIMPMVTGHLDPAVLAAITAEYLATWQPATPERLLGAAPTPPLPDPAPPLPDPAPPLPDPAAGTAPAAVTPPDDQPQHTGPPGAAAGSNPPGTPAASGPPTPASVAACPAGDACPRTRTSRDLSPATTRRLQDIILRWAADLLSGPTGLAAHLRNATTGDTWPNVSLPLDVGRPTRDIPPHLRKAVAVRDRHCAFPGCDRPPRTCQCHHVIPHEDHGIPRLSNLVLLCSYHHLIAVHRDGWKLVLHGDGTTSATSPDGQRTYHSHGPTDGGPAG